MGWTFYANHNSPRTYAEEKAEIIRLFTPARDSAVTFEVLQASKVGSAWYVAVKITGREQGRYVTGPDGSFVAAAVILTRRSDGWGYKDMDEHAGPNESRAPVSLLAKLSPLTDTDLNDYARQWRDRCTAYAKRYKPEIGHRLKLANPVTLQNGSEIQTFDVMAYTYRGKRRRFYRSLENGCDYRLDAYHLAGATRLQ